MLLSALLVLVLVFWCGVVWCGVVRGGVGVSVMCTCDMHVCSRLHVRVRCVRACVDPTMFVCACDVVTVCVCGVYHVRACVCVCVI